jgi:hypothetical protein
MTPKDLYRYRILKEHSVLVDFEGTVERTNVPAQKDRETFKQWTKRVLGDNVSDVRVMAWYEPDPREQMKKLREFSRADVVERMIKATRQDGKANEKAAVYEDRHKFTTFPRQSLEDVRDELVDTLEPPVKDLIQNLLKSSGDDIEFDVLLRELILKYNDTVRAARELMK